MKILNLYFKNINSLEGESRIPFDKAPISDAGVFAITGPNGSGKSTILDAITLGLYGETYRFDKPAEHVMTKQTTESFAQVEFALGEEKYRSIWQVKRSGSNAQGELLAPEMTLTRLNGEEQVLEQSAIQVRNRIAELIGMDFHKFTKSMVLAQGDFAAFLNALDSERMDILEKITGGDIYQEYRQQAEQKYEQVQTRLTQIKQDLETTPVMDDAAVEAGQYDLQDFTEQLAEFKAKQIELEKHLDWVRNIDALNSQIAALQNKQQVVSNARDEHQQILNRIAEVKTALEFKDEVSLLNNKTGQLEQSEQTLENYRKEIELLQQQLDSMAVEKNVIVSDKSVSEQKQTVDQLKLKLVELKQELPQENTLLQSISQQLSEKKSALSAVETWLRENEQDRILLDNFPETGKLKSLRTELADLKNKQKSHAKWNKKTTSALKKNKALIKKKSKAIKILQKKLAADQQAIKDRTEGKSFEELEELKIEQQERVNDFRELYELAKVNAGVSKKGIFGFFIGHNGNKIEQEEHILVDKLNTVQLEIVKEENIRKMLEKAVANEVLLRKMQVDRDKLEDGKPCPLCGALKHPYVVKPPVISDSKKALADQRGKVQALKSRADSIRLQIKVLQKQEQQDADKDNRLQLVRSQWRSLCNRLNTASSRLDIDNLSLMKKLFKAERQELNDIDKLVKKCTKLHLGIERMAADISENESALERLKVENEQLDAEWDNRPRELVELEKSYEQCKADEKALAAQVEKQLAELGESMPAKGQEDDLFDRLNRRRQEYQTRLMRQKVLREEIESLQEKVEICQEDVDELNQKLQEQSALLQTEEVVGLHLALIEKQKMIADKEQLFVQQQNELSELQQDLKSKLIDTRFNNLDDLNGAFQLIEQRADVERQLLDENQKLENIVSDIELLETQLEKDQAVALTSLNEQEILGEKQQLKEKLDIAEQEVRSLENKLSKQKFMREKVDGLQQQLQEQQILLKECEGDIQLINDENAVPFRRKVQQEMIDRLLSKANQVLEKISGRYYVRNVPSEHGFALEIEDTQQNNSRRLPKTLSGGEGFVVSLALALALAESAKNGHAIDSLFLDEGFGNLDAESLYLVMTTLESLKTHGKIVGIISHVEGVKKRVKTRIEMIKKPNGLSALKMAS